MGIPPGGFYHETSDLPPSRESELDIIHRKALESEEPAVIEALKNLHVLVKLYHADEIAEEMEDFDKNQQGLRRRMRKMMSTKQRTDVVDVQKVMEYDNSRGAEAEFLLKVLREKHNIKDENRS